MTKSENQKPAEARKPKLRLMRIRSLNEFKDEGIRKLKCVGGAPSGRYEGGNVALSKRQTKSQTVKAGKTR